MCVPCLAVIYIEALINVLALALTLAIFVRVLGSWVPLRLPFGLSELVWGVSEPILGPIRRALPLAAGLDFSPFIALLLIQTLREILLRLLPTVF